MDRRARPFWPRLNRPQRVLIMGARPWAQGSLRRMYEHYPHIGPVLPAMGYSAQQETELEGTIAATDCDTVIDATPATLARIIKLSKPVVRVDYELEERGPDLIRALDRFAERHGLTG